MSKCFYISLFVVFGFVINSRAGDGDALAKFLNASEYKFLFENDGSDPYNIKSRLLELAVARGADLKRDIIHYASRWYSRYHYVEVPNDLSESDLMYAAAHSMDGADLYYVCSLSELKNEACSLLHQLFLIDETIQASGIDKENVASAAKWQVANYFLALKSETGDSKLEFLHTELPTEFMQGLPTRETYKLFTSQWIYVLAAPVRYIGPENRREVFSIIEGKKDRWSKKDYEAIVSYLEKILGPQASREKYYGFHESNSWETFSELTLKQHRMMREALDGLIRKNQIASAQVIKAFLDRQSKHPTALSLRQELLQQRMEGEVACEESLRAIRWPRDKNAREKAE